jgi:hypothetical protein
MNYYQLDDPEIFPTFDTPESGLTEEEARKRMRRYGPNRLAAVLTLLLREYVDAGVKVEYILDKGR